MKDIVICIGREYGSGGRFIAKMLSEKLNIPCYDKEKLNEFSSSELLDKAIIDKHDEVPNNLLYLQAPMKNGNLPVNQRVFLAQFDAIRNVASKGSCVIIGRCSDYVLEDKDNVISIFITAPMNERINRAVKYYNLDSSKALKQIKKMDKKRKDYYNFYTNRSWGEASNYDLTINSKIGPEKVVEVIIKYIEAL